MIELSKAHILSDSPTSMNISSYAQETMCYMGQHLVFKEAEDFIADGATWIWNWVEDTYPECERIVDFFHAKEHCVNLPKSILKTRAIENSG